MNRKLKGSLGEAKVLAHLVQNEYQVFLPFEENGEIDMIAIKDSILLKVSVKTTSSKTEYGRYAVTLKTVSRRKDNKVAIKHFDSSIIDLLAVYIIPLDRVVLIPAIDIKGKSCLHINPENCESGNRSAC